MAEQENANCSFCEDIKIHVRYGFNAIHEYHLKSIQIFENGFYVYGKFVAR